MSHDIIREDAKSLARAWAWALLQMSERWVFNCDSGCYASYCLKRMTHREGYWVVIYQPSREMYRCLDDIAHIIIKRCDRKRITNKLINTAEKYMREVDNLYLQSYNDILNITSGKWFYNTNGSLDEVAQIISPMELIEKSSPYRQYIRFSFTLRCPVNDGCCGNPWHPARIIQYLGDDLSRCPIDANGERNKSIDANSDNSNYNEIDDYLSQFMTEATPAKLWSAQQLSEY